VNPNRFCVCCRRRKTNRQRAALQDDLRYCIDGDGRYYKQQRQYPLLLKPDQSTGDRPQYQGFAPSARTRTYAPSLPAPPPPPTSCLLGSDPYSAYTPVDATSSLLGTAHPTSGAVPAASGRGISTGSDVTSHVTSAGGRRPYPALQPVEHIYESPKFVRRGSDGDADDYDDDVTRGDTGSGMRCPTSRQMSTSSAVVTTFH